MPRAFSLKDCKYALLTYSALGEDPEFVLECANILGTKLAGRFEDSTTTVGRELHPNTGGYHLHIFVDFGGAISVRGTDIFDIVTGDGRCFHPNIQKVGRTPAKSYDYAIKDGDILWDNCSRPEDKARANNWKHIVEADTAEEFWTRIRELEPRALCVSNPSLSKYADKRYARPAISYDHPEEWVFNLVDYPDLGSWLQNELGERGMNAR